MNIFSFTMCDLHRAQSNGQARIEEDARYQAELNSGFFKDNIEINRDLIIEQQ